LFYRKTFKNGNLRIKLRFGNPGGNPSGPDVLKGLLIARDSKICEICSRARPEGLATKAEGTICSWAVAWFDLDVSRRTT